MKIKLNDLYCPIPLSQFKTRIYRERIERNGITIQIDKDTVMLNNNGKCSIQQYGTDQQARQKFDDICEAIS